MHKRTTTFRDDLFWAKVDRTTTPEGCWTWTAARLPAGYGRFSIGDNRIELAHRYAYILAHGEIPAGTVIDHCCHNKSCVRADHLRAVTMKQNTEHHSGPRRNNRSGVHGVGWCRIKGKWRARVKHNRMEIAVGYFDTLAEAEAAVIAKRLELFTHNDLDRTA